MITIHVMFAQTQIVVMDGRRSFAVHFACG